MEAIDVSRGYRQLLAWRRSFVVADACLNICDALPAAVRRVLGNQIQRASVSVPANIAEGYGRRSRGDYLRHVRIAHGSLLELDTHLLLARRRPRVDVASVDAVLDECAHVGRLIGGLMRSLEGHDPRMAKTPGKHPGA